MNAGFLVHLAANLDMGCFSHGERALTINDNQNGSSTITTYSELRWFVGSYYGNIQWNHFSLTPRYITNRMDQ